MTDRKYGCMYGLAVGDALGTTAEFQARDTYDITDMVGGGPFSLKPGEWTDDTSMALCLAESLIDGFSLERQLELYCRWYLEGYWSVNGRCFDIGGTTRGGLENFIETKGTTAPYDEKSLGNGSIMRLAPVPIWAVSQGMSEHECVNYSALSSLTTHSHPICLDACRYLGAVIYRLLKGCEKEEALGMDDISPEIQFIASRRYLDKDRDDIQSSGYVVHTLEAALWCFETTSTFRAGALKAVNLGLDTDTVGAVYGQIAGAYYGITGIPADWLAILSMREEIDELISKL